MEKRNNFFKAVKSIKTEYFLMIIVSLFWAVGHPVGRILTEKVHPFQIGTITLWAGFIGLAVYLIVSKRIKKIRELSAGSVFISLGLGVFGFFLYQILTFSALARIPASMNAVLVSTNVVFIVLFAAIILKERIKPLSIIGVALSLIGVVIVTFNQGFSFAASPGGIDLLGCAFSLLAAISFALYSVIGKKVLVSGDPIIIAAIALFAGAVLLAILTVSTVGFSEIAMAGWSTFIIMIFLGFAMIGIAYPLWFYCLKNLPASHISLYIYLTPVFAVILSLIILNERFSWLFWIGGILILAGIIIANRFSADKKSKQNPDNKKFKKEASLK